MTSVPGVFAWNVDSRRRFYYVIWVFAAVTVWLIGRLVDASRLPSYGSAPTGYLEFVAIGIAVSVFVQLGLGRVAAQPVDLGDERREGVVVGHAQDGDEVVAPGEVAEGVVAGDQGVDGARAESVGHLLVEGLQVRVVRQRAVQDEVALVRHVGLAVLSQPQRRVRQQRGHPRLRMRHVDFHIDQAAARQGIEGGLIEVQAPGLPDRFFVPVHAQRQQLRHDGLVGTGDDTRRIDVFDAQQPLPVMGARVQVAGHRGQQGSVVQGTAGAGRKAPAIPRCGGAALDVRRHAAGPVQCDKRV